MLAALKPLGVWGIGGLAVIDSSTIPVPIDALLIDYVANDHKRFLLYCFMAALGSAIGSLLPYYLGRAGGELFLLKRINRQRYEQLRDRFEKQEFLAIMVPAMMPPPMPVKLFEFAAGVFEMKSAVVLQRHLRGQICAVSDLGDYYDHVRADDSGNDHENHARPSELRAAGRWNRHGGAAGLCGAQGVRSAAGNNSAG